MRALCLCVVVFASCKKQEAVQQAAPVETSPIVAATTPAASAEPVATIAAASASASATPREHTAAELEAERNAARKAALEEASQFGMLGTLTIGDGGDALGRGEGIGLGNIGTLGGGRYDGGSRSENGRAHPPSIRQGAITVNGRLPPEVIQRIARQNFGRFRLCYENGLRSNPSLQGRVAVKYIIDRDGSVKGTPTDGGSDLPDQGVVQCVIRGFQNLSYPEPEGGIVSVVYPLIFSPGS